MPARVLTGDLAMSDVPRQRPVTNTPRWRIHHTLKGRVSLRLAIRRRYESASLISWRSRSASRRKYDTACSPAITPLQHTRLGVAAVENGALSERPALSCQVLMRLTTKRASSSSLKRNKGKSAHRPRHRSTVFYPTPVVVFNQGVRGAQNIAGRA